MFRSAQGPGSAFEIAAPTRTQLLAGTAAAVAASGLLLFSAVPASLADITTVTPQEATQMAKPLKRQEVKKGRIWTLFVLGATALFGSTGAAGRWAAAGTLVAGLETTWRQLPDGWVPTQDRSSLPTLPQRPPAPAPGLQLTCPACLPAPRRAVVLENNEKWFPAISRANRAMKSARDQMAAREAAAAAEQAAFEQRLAAVQAERRADAVVDNAVLEGLQEARQRSALAAAPAAAAPAAPSLPAAATEVEPELEEEEEEVEVQAAPGSSSGSGMAEAGAADGSGSSGSAAAWEVRKPLFEISAEQIEASSRLQELQQELERRKAEAAAAGAGAGAAAAPAGSSAQQEP